MDYLNNKFKIIKNSIMIMYNIFILNKLIPSNHSKKYYIGSKSQTMKKR